MVDTRRHSLCLPYIPRRRFSIFISVAIIFVIFRCLPSGNNRIVSGKWLPDYDVGDVPRYLHHSSYRDYPDYEYERKLSNALQLLEKDVLEKNGYDYVGQDRIWQIRLGDHPEGNIRPQDSLMFEEQNVDWQYTLVTDNQANHFITNVLVTIPELKHLYDSYPHAVIRSDLLRYLLLWYFGGYYADTDVYPKRTIKTCPSLKPFFAESDAPANVSLAVGIEIDEPNASPRLMRDWHWIRTYGLVQYTIFAPQRFSPLLRQVIVRVLSHTRQHNKHSLPFLGPRYNEETILEVTGPGVFTDAIIDALSDALPTTHPLIDKSVESDPGMGDMVSQTGEIARRLTWAPFHQISDPVCVDANEAAVGKSMGGLCVLPINAWGNGQRHSGAEDFRSQHACVNHRFGGSWKKDWWYRHFG
ncbi:hypothetical protein BJX99DRAFT_228670 [Aspergillus californicus]